MLFEYFRRWSQWERCGLQPLTVAQAKKLHASGRLYTVLVGESPDYLCYIDVRLEVRFVGVHFLDDLNRGYLTYFYDQIEDERMFLKEIWLMLFEGDSEEIEKKEHFVFRPDGHVFKEIYHSSVVDSSEITGVDVTCHWERIPEFGQYESISRADR